MTTSQPTGCDVILGELGDYDAMEMIKHNNSVKLITCVNGRSNCSQAYFKVCLTVSVI